MAMKVIFAIYGNLHIEALDVIKQSSKDRAWCVSMNPSAITDSIGPLGMNLVEAYIAISKRAFCRVFYGF